MLCRCATSLLLSGDAYKRAMTLTPFSLSVRAGAFDKVQCKQKADKTTDVFCGRDGYF